MRNTRNKVIGVLGAVSFLLGISPAISAQAAPNVTGSVDSVSLPSGAEAFVYVPDGIQLVSWTAPVVLVLADEPFTAESAAEFAEQSGLAAKALADQAVVTFVNPIGEDWTAADVATYDQVVNRLYIERPTPSTWSGGRADGIANGRDAAYPVVYQGYARRTHVIATGAGADFVSTHLTNDALTTPLGFPFTKGPASVLLFNTTAVPTAQYYEYPAIVINGSPAVTAKYASLTESHRFASGSSATTDGFDLSIIADRYDQLTSIMSAQMMRDNPAAPPQDNPSNRFTVDLSDFEALGVAPEQVDLTLSQNRPAMYLSYVPDGVKQTADGSVPLVMIFHGSGERSEWFALHTDWPALAAKEGFIVVALDDHIGQRTPGNLSTDQVVEVMDDVFDRYPQIDRTRVYASGFSAGSFRTNTLGTQRPDLFAAIAPMNGATNPTGAVDDLVMPVMMFGGEADTLTSNFPGHTGPVYTGAVTSTDRLLNQYFKMNNVRGGTYAYDTSGSNPKWGLTPDAVETRSAENGDAVFTVNSLQSADGNVYTKLVNISRAGHFVFPDEAPLAWEFFKQFSRNADGSISITDDTRPEVTLVAPTSAGPHQSIQIRVDATDNVGLRRIVANVYDATTNKLVKSTQTAITTPVKTGTHTATVTLPSGSYYVKFNAQDLAGNISKTSQYAVTIDTTKPTATIKDGSSYTVKTGETYDLISFKLHDAQQIDKIVLNGVVKDLTNNHWSDLNFVRPGQFGAVRGANLLVVHDVAGNTQNYEFVLN